MKSEEQIKTLVELGLTLDQARAYLALTQVGIATAKTISDISKIAKPDIYRIIPSLQEQGIVEKLITKPSSFQAVPMEYALPALLKRKETEQYLLRKKTEEMLSDSKNNHLHSLLDSEVEVIIIPKAAIIKRLNESILKNQNCLFIITTRKQFSASILEFETNYRKALEKGVKIKIATDRHIPQKKTLRIIKTFTEKSNFEVKFLEDAPPTIVSIFDDKEAYVMLSASAQLADASALWSTNPSFVALTQNYFENKWFKARPFLNLIAESKNAPV